MEDYSDKIAALEDDLGCARADVEFLTNENKGLTAEVERLKNRLRIAGIPGGDPGEGGWTSRHETRVRIKAAIEPYGAGIDDDVLDTAAALLDSAEAEVERLQEENGDLRLAVGHANDHADLAIHDMEQANAEVERLREVRDAAVCLDAYLRANGIFARQEVLPLVDLRAALDAAKEDTNV